MRPNLLDPLVPLERLHPHVSQLRTWPGAEPTRLMMEEVFQTFGAADHNFVEQFQTTGFDARVFELFLHAYFTRSPHAGFEVERASERPDYLVTRNGVTVAVEATTANPTQVSGDKSLHVVGLDLNAPEQSEAEIQERIDHELPIRLGSALYSKLKKRYWELPHVLGRPLVFAIEMFHAKDALLLTSVGLAQYLYGLKQSFRYDHDGQLVIDTAPVTVHRQGDKEIRSEFFALPNAEHVSAVLFTNAGTYGKFTRMGFQAGLHRGNVIVVRRGFEYDHDVNASKPKLFAYRLDEAPGEEPWGSGLEVFHNPRALNPLPDDFFVDAYQTHLKKGVPVSYLPEFAPITSVTVSTYLGFQSLQSVEEAGEVGTILKREFEARDLVRPPYDTHDVPFGEVAWFSNAARSVVGTVLRWHSEEQYGYVVLQPDEHGKWRATEFDDGLPSLDAAATAISTEIRRLSA